MRKIKPKMLRMREWRKKYTMKMRKRKPKNVTISDTDALIDVKSVMSRLIMRTKNGLKALAKRARIKYIRFY